MDRSLESFEGRSAARFAAVYIGLRRRAVAPPAALPRAFAPLPLEAIVGLARPRARGADDEPPVERRCRRSVAATLAAAGVHDGAWLGLMYPEERRALARGGGGCRYCAATRAVAGARGRREVETRKHASIEIGFDPDTFVSWTRVSGLEVVIPTPQLGLFFERADPRNWAQPGSDFFRRSQTGAWTKDGWQGGRAWARPDRGQIYELALAQINESIAFEIHNILDISGFQNDLAGRAGSADIPIALEHATLKYDYALQQNLGSKLGFIWETEGIDIDNGRYRADARRIDEQSWQVSITVEKRLRYTAPQSAPPETGALLNEMSPAFLSLFMHEVVYGVLKDLDGGAAGAPPGF